jgi:hypothetical protein
VDAISHYKLILAVCIALSVISTGVVALRLWVRARSRGMAADDWMATLSVIFAMLYSILCIWRESFFPPSHHIISPRDDTRHTCGNLPLYGSTVAHTATCADKTCATETKYGLGLPIALRPAANLVPFTRVNYAGRPIYQVGISFFKIALLISYLRLFDGTNQRVYRHVVWLCIALVFLSHLGCAMALILACDPVNIPPRPL